jgi:septal ring factor EnvC (AmiA/AmiB activator)
MTDRRQSFAWRAAALAALFLAAASLVVALIAVTKPAAKQQKISLTAITGEARSLKTEVSSLKAELATLHALVAKADASLAKIMTCLPELTGQIGSLSIETSTLTIGERNLVTSAYLKTGKQISTYCASTLEASAR